MTAPLRVVGVRTPLGTFLPQFFMGSVKENLRPEDTSSALQTQEIPFDHPDSRYMFQPGDKPFLATPAAIELHGDDIGRWLIQLQTLALEKNGLDYLQVVTIPGRPEPLWFIEDDDGGAITALLPSDY